MKTLKWLLITLGGLALLTIVLSGSWIVTESAIQATSGQAFCGACHSMKPFAETYALDTHGGHNPKGLAAACADCHLPHDGQATYLFAKAKTGLYDIWAEVAAIFKEPDWQTKLEHPEAFVYDSGCLTCHARLEHAEDQSQTALFGHQTYFRSEGAMHCVTCHTHVGHKDLAARLSPELEDAAEQAGRPQEQAQ